jgi:hypothetical protein
MLRAATVKSSEKFMYLAYLDDSESHDKRYQIVAGVIVQDRTFSRLESELAFVIEEYVPEELRANFEFHASDLFQCRGAFRDLDQTRAFKILAQCANRITELKLPVVYGAVDVDRHRKTIMGNAEPISVGFRICAMAIEAWLEANANDDLGILVFDDTQKKDVKIAIQEAFRHCRKTVISSPPDRGLLPHIHDDLYFGDSAFSFGIQAADVCAYLINRHLNNRADTEEIYRSMKGLIVASQTVPDGVPS